DENLRRALGSAQRALEERVALARKLHDQDADKGQNLLAQTWSERMREFERELKVVRDGMQRMEQIAAASEQAAQRAADDSAEELLGGAVFKVLAIAPISGRDAGYVVPRLVLTWDRCFRSPAAAEASMLRPPRF